MAGFVVDFRRSWRTAGRRTPALRGAPRLPEVSPADGGAPARVPIVGRSSAAAHSARSAKSGSTRVARRAGIQHATTVTETSTTAIAMKVIGSVALTP